MWKLLLLAFLTRSRLLNYFNLVPASMILNCWLSFYNILEYGVLNVTRIMTSHDFNLSVMWLVVNLKRWIFHWYSWRTKLRNIWQNGTNLRYWKSQTASNTYKTLRNYHCEATDWVANSSEITQQSFESDCNNYKSATTKNWINLRKYISDQIKKKWRIAYWRGNQMNNEESSYQKSGGDRQRQGLV
jgi:hypothetical protein